MDRSFTRSPDAASANECKGPLEANARSEQVEGLKRSLDMQMLLVSRLLDGNGLNDLTRSLADFIKCSVLIEDSGSSVLSLAFAEETPAEQKEQIRSFLPRRASSLKKNAVSKNTRLGQPVAVTDDHDGLPIYRLIYSIHTDGEPIGNLSVIRLGESFTDNEGSVIKNAASLFAVQLLQDKKIAEIELRLKGNFVEDLISTHYSDPDSIMNRARALEYNIKMTHRVLVAEIENMKQLINHFYQNPNAAAKFKIELVKSIQNRLNQSVKGMVIHHNDEIILLVQLGTSNGSIGDLKNLCEEIIRLVSAQFSAKMFIGIGSTCHELPDYAKSYLAAKKSLEIGTYMITEGQVRSYEQFSVHALFMSTLKPAELYNYARGQLGALLDYDKKHHTELMKTLQEFLYLRNNVERTARTINMSVSGLKYRLQKIEKIIGLELQDYKVSFDLQLGLIILQLFGEYRIKNPEE